MSCLGQGNQTQTQGQRLDAGASGSAFYKLVTLLDISVDEFFYPDRHNGEDERRKHLDRMLNGMDEKELIIMEGAAEGIRKAREHQE